MSEVRNVVLVHGAFVDGSGWRPVYDILAAAGYHVSVVQQPLTSLPTHHGYGCRQRRQSFQERYPAARHTRPRPSNTP